MPSDRAVILAPIWIASRFAADSGTRMSDREIDLQLVERVREGDKRAFGLLVEKYRRKIIRLLSRMVRDPDDLEDIAQDTFIKAYRALPQFRGDAAFYTWLYRIAVNTAKNHLVLTRAVKLKRVHAIKMQIDAARLRPSVVLAVIDQEQVRRRTGRAPGRTRDRYAGNGTLVETSSHSRERSGRCAARGVAPGHHVA